MSAPAEVDLAKSVILQAVRDVMLRCDGGSGRPQIAEQRAARLFLTEQTGEWASSRQLWCDLAGFDADALRARIVAVLARPVAAGMERARVAARLLA